MFSKTAIALATASLALGASALVPAMANYDRCYEDPAATGCPGNYDVNQKQSNMTAHSYKGAEHYRYRY